MTKHSLALTASLKPLACLGLLLLPLTPTLAGDPAAGAAVYRARCAHCHSVMPDENRKGPTFAGLIGRTAGSVPTAKYSKSLRASKIYWTPETINAYLAHPAKVVPGAVIDHHRLIDARARVNLIAFLASDSTFFDSGLHDEPLSTDQPARSETGT